MASQAYIQVEGTNKSKFELGDDPERTGVYTMDFEVVNFSDGEKTYTLDTTVLGQKADGGKIQNGKVTYLVYDYARELDATVTSSATDGRITVPAHSSTQGARQRYAVGRRQSLHGRAVPLWFLCGGLCAAHQ